ncbi:MAG: riboflavin synthase, partial [Candidatus Zixiibacteriota bacterium]
MEQDLMFTGLIETTGTIEKLTSRGDYTVMTIASSFPHDELVIGESISCDGACLTVIEKAIGGFVVEASHETTARTVLSQYRVGARLNLERALKVGSRLGGHFVSGHVDTVGVVDYIKLVGESIELAVRFDSEFDAWVIEKGSIAINGVSLTINRTSSGWL